jgi:hypothetical protein
VITPRTLNINYIIQFALLRGFNKILGNKTKNRLKMGRRYAHIKKIAMASRKKSKKGNDTYVKISIDRDDGLS